MNSPFFSVVMPAYNAEKFIGRAIESVLAQTYSDWELVIVNDCSTDNTLKIANYYAAKDNRIRAFSLEHNSGSAYQPRKTAIEKSIGQYIVSLDSDDTYENSYLQKIRTRIDDTNADMVIVSLVHPDFVLPSKSFNINQILKGKDVVKLTLKKWQISGVGAIRKIIMEAAFKELDSLVNLMNADEILTRIVLFKAPIVAFTDAKYFYERNENSITQKISLKLFDSLYSDSIICEFIRNNYPVGSVEIRLAETQRANNILNLTSIYDKNKHKFRQHSHEILSKLKKHYKGVKLDLIAEYISKKKLFALYLGIDGTLIAHRIIKLIKGK